MAEYQKAVVEKKAKEIEVNLSIKSSSKSLLRYLARVKACQELYKDDAAAIIEQMIQKNYKAAPPAASWIAELEASAAKDAADLLVKVLGAPVVASPKPPKSATSKSPSTQVAHPSTPPAVPPPQATQNLNDLLGVTPPKPA